MKTQRRKSGGKPIRGSLAPFRNFFDPLFERASTNEGFDILREMLKDASALRMTYVIGEPLSISDECIRIIKDQIPDEYVASFVICATAYYRGHKTHKVKLDKTSSSFGSLDFRKSIKHAQKDCLECSDHYLGRMKKIILDDTLKHQVSATTKAVDFFVNWIYELYVGRIPRKINKLDYFSIIKNTPELEKLYTLDANESYVASKRVLYKDLTIETATKLFCVSWRYKQGSLFILD